MSFEIVKNDITNMHVDAIVYASSSHQVTERDFNTDIYKKAGPEMLAARLEHCIPTGHAATTPAGRLPAQFIIHTVAPIWKGGSANEEALLRSCYSQSLRAALRRNCQSVAFPLIAMENDIFSTDRALRIAISVFSKYLLEYDLTIYLVLPGNHMSRLSKSLFRNISGYINVYYEDPDYKPPKACRRKGIHLFPKKAKPVDVAPCGEAPVPMMASLSDYLMQEDVGFTEMLLKLIDKTGKKDSEIYKRANLSKQHFSKIRNNPYYKPTKQTAIALALALELNLEQTRDLIARAGYALSNSSKFDLIIRYFIEQKNYNVVEINMALYEFDQSLLGS